METKATNFIYAEPRSRVLKKTLDTSSSGKCLPSAPKVKTKVEEKSQFLEDVPLKASPGVDPIMIKLHEGSVEKKGSAKYIKVSQGIESQGQEHSIEKLGVTKDTQLKASRDVSASPNLNFHP